MSFKVQPIEGDKWELVFSDEPSYIHALKMAPERMEPELNSGVWLVVTFPVWSGTCSPLGSCGGRLCQGPRWRVPAWRAALRFSRRGLQVVARQRSAACW